MQLDELLKFAKKNKGKTTILTISESRGNQLVAQLVKKLGAAAAIKKCDPGRAPDFIVLDHDFAFSLKDVYVFQKARVGAVDKGELVPVDDEEEEEEDGGKDEEEEEEEQGPERNSAEL